MRGSAARKPTNLQPSGSATRHKAHRPLQHLHQSPANHSSQPSHQHILLDRSPFPPALPAPVIPSEGPPPVLQLDGLPVLRLEGLPVLWWDGLPAIRLECLPILWWDGLPAIRLECLPVLWWDGLPALRLEYLPDGLPVLRLECLPDGLPVLRLECVPVLCRDGLPVLGWGWLRSQVVRWNWLPVLREDLRPRVLWW
jgi:hypothetical protein